MAKYSTIAALLALAAPCVALPVSAADTPKMEKLTLSKECSQYSGGLPSFCTVLESNLSALRKGTKVLYYGPVTNNPAFSSNSVILDTGDGSTAIGNCIVDFGAGPKGICAFYGGSGALAGFSAIVEVTVDAKMVWHWDGSYAIAK